VTVELRAETYRSLPEYAAIPIAYEVRAAFDARALGTRRPPLPHRIVAPPYRKDYDAVPDNHPADWSRRFDVDQARFVAAYSGARRVGGAVLIVDPRDVARLGGQRGFALLWDLRVAPEARGRGIGRALLAAAEASARTGETSGVVAETQTTNFAACQLYAGAEYALTAIDAAAYPDLPDEIRVIWTKTFEAPFALRE